MRAPRLCGAVPFLTLVILVAGCNQPRRSEAPAKKAPVYFTVNPAEAAIVRGEVRFEGKHPAARKISMDADGACQELHKEPVFDEQVRVSQQGGLANVFVYVKRGLEGKVFAPAQKAVVLDQRGCQFVPRIIALRAGQTLDVKNSDPVAHNVHPMPRNNYDWNQQQAPGSEDLERRFARPEIMIPVKCNIHSWMKCYIAVLEHPFFAVTGRKGEFSIEGLPPGEYTLAAWHESLGELTEAVTVHKGESVTARFAFQ